MAIETASLSKDVEDMNSYATWRNVLGHTFVFLEEILGRYLFWIFLNGGRKKSYVLALIN